MVLKKKKCCPQLVLKWSNHYVVIVVYLCLLRDDTHVENILSQLLRFDTGEHPEQKVHDGRGSNVFDHQIYEVLPLPQKVDDLNRNRL